MGALETITRHDDGCTAGDVGMTVGTLDPGVVHRFLAPDPGSVRGANHLARYRRKVAGLIEA